MPRQIPWFERAFPMTTDPRLSAEVIARLAGAPERCAGLARACTGTQLRRRLGDTWSVQENIAHLADLDRVLFIPRLDQFAAGEKVLLAADTTNATTNGADHQSRSIEEVLAGFEETRARVVRHLDGVSLERFADSVLHERLGVTMRLIDLCVFFAEHDDSHLARIRELIAIGDA